MIQQTDIIWIVNTDDCYIIRYYSTTFVRIWLSVYPSSVSVFLFPCYLIRFPWLWLLYCIRFKMGDYWSLLFIQFRFNWILTLIRTILYIYRLDATPFEENHFEACSIIQRLNNVFTPKSSAWRVVFLVSISFSIFVYWY